MILHDMMGGGAEARTNAHQQIGFTIGIVTNIVHDGGDYRVKVRFPTLPNGGSDGEDSTWCRIISYMAGKDRGVFWLPEVEDEVLVGFLNGDFNQPIVFGGMWNGSDKPIYSNKDATGKVTDLAFQGKHEAKKNDLRVFRSRVGHQLIFNDNASEPRVALHSQQKHRIVLDDKNNQPTQIEIYDGSLFLSSSTMRCFCLVCSARRGSLELSLKMSWWPRRERMTRRSFFFASCLPWKAASVTLPDASLLL